MSCNIATLDDVFATVKTKFPTILSTHGWYILTASALITCADPDNFGRLYVYMIDLPEFATPAQRQRLSRRLREQLLKQWVVVGIPRTITALRALVRVERTEDADSTFTRQHVAMDDATRERGQALLRRFYQDEVDIIFSGWGAHSRDFTWLAENIIFGMFFSDENLLNSMETEMMIYAAITCQDLRNPTRRHLRGMRRFGASHKDVAAVTACVKVVAEWCGKDTSSWLGIRDLEPDLEQDRD